MVVGQGFQTQSGSPYGPLKPTPVTAQQHLYHILMVKASYEVSPGSRSGETDCILWWKSFKITLQTRRRIIAALYANMQFFSSSRLWSISHNCWQPSCKQEVQPALEWSWHQVNRREMEILTSLSYWIKPTLPKVKTVIIRQYILLIVKMSLS